MPKTLIFKSLSAFKVKSVWFIVPRSGLVTTMTGKLSLFITSDIKQSLLMGTNKPPEPSVITISHSFSSSL